jgi:hypothetical protein
MVENGGVTGQKWRGGRAIRFNKNEGSGGKHGRRIWRSNTL